MFVVNLTYVKPLEEVDALLEEHVEYLKRQYEKGVFLASGRKVPRSGGVIFARAQPRADLEQTLSEDPFHKGGIAKYDVIEFVPTMTGQGFENLREELPA